MESNTKSAFAENLLFETSANRTKEVISTERIRLLQEKSNCKAIMRGQKFGFIKRVDKGWITTVKDL